MDEATVIKILGYWIGAFVVFFGLGAIFKDGKNKLSLDEGWKTGGWILTGPVKLVWKLAIVALSTFIFYGVCIVVKFIAHLLWAFLAWFFHLIWDPIPTKGGKNEE